MTDTDQKMNKFVGQPRRDVLTGRRGLVYLMKRKERKNEEKGGRMKRKGDEEKGETMERKEKNEEKGDEEKGEIMKRKEKQ